MFEQQDSSKWQRSLPLLIGASIIFPPLGLILLWSRGDFSAKKKLLGTACLVLLSAGYFGAFKLWQRSFANESHYTALEQHRAQQQIAGQPASPQTPVSPSATASPAPGTAASPSPSTAEQPVAAHASRNYWTNYRGPKRDGNYEELNVTTRWPAEGLAPLWKQPVGVGFASFAVADGRAYTIEQRRRQEVVVAYDPATGRELWTQAWNAEYKDETGDGPRATPTWDDGRIYALGATGELRCLDANSGKVLWGKNILSENRAENLPWAMAASPLVVDDKVIVLPGGSQDNSVVAYNKLTGAPVWRALKDRQAYVSPMLVTLAGRRQILIITANRAAGLAPEDGSLLWSYPWDTDMGINASQPLIVSANRVFLSAGYGKGAALVEISGSGKNFNARAVWENINMKNKFNSSVLHQGYVYGLDEGIMTCVDVNTGERKWKGGRYGYGQVLLASGHLIVLTDTGDLVLVRATPDQHAEIARFKALEGKTWNYPAIADGRLLVRNANEMAAYNIAAQ
jgi:outer membrane protein assembly factor BamB